MKPLARIELSGEVPAEVLRLLPLVGLDPATSGSTAAASGVIPQRPIGDPVTLHVQFVQRSSATYPDRQSDARDGILTIVLDPAASDDHWVGDLSTDSPIAAVSLILSRALGLTLSFLTCDSNLFDLVRAAVAVAPGSSRVLVEGELAVGKKSLIELIHTASRNPIAIVNAECAGLGTGAITDEFENLLASAARHASSGGQGAIFFNRIGELSPAAQRHLSDLLRSLDSDSERSSRAGKMRIFASSACSTAAPAGEMLGELRDLFDLTLMIPPLRTRPGDISLLARYYLHRLDSTLTFNASALRTLSAYPFPGNFIELTNLITRLAISPVKARGRGSTAPDSCFTILGRADIASQLDRRTLKAIYRSRKRRRSSNRKSHRLLPQPQSDSIGILAPPPSDSPPASLRLTPTASPRTRKLHPNRDGSS